MFVSSGVVPAVEELPAPKELGPSNTGVSMSVVTMLSVVPSVLLVEYPAAVDVGRPSALTSEIP